ncbi:MAG: signal peptidase I [Bacilli bacterium]|nr:signal peptidase I [Bacilli bacterium]
MKRKEFILNLLYSVVPMILIIPLSIWALSQMSKGAYDCFFVMGTSMEPYLSGSENQSTYGYSDNSDKAIDNLKRFDLVICYYPFEGQNDYEMPYNRYKPILTETATLKVKRVIGLPGDKLTIDNENFSITDKNGITENYNEENCPFKRKTPIENRKADVKKLEDNEYFVMGDNWTKNGSLDCCNPSAKATKYEVLYRENIQGVIFKLEGNCTYGPLKHCKSCKKVVDDDVKECSCGSTKFLVYNDIIEKRPYEDGPIYIK